MSNLLDFQVRYFAAMEKAFKEWHAKHPDVEYLNIIAYEVEAHPDVLDQLVHCFLGEWGYVSLALIDNPNLPRTTIAFSVKEEDSTIKGPSTRNGVPLD